MLSHLFLMQGSCNTLESQDKSSALTRFLAVEPRRKGDLWRALWALTRAKLQLKAGNSKATMSGLTRLGGLPGLPEPTSAQAARVRELVWAVRAVGRRVPWSSVCLDQALALQQMMRSIPGAIVLGAHHRDCHEQEQRRVLAAHAWVVCGSEIVLGAAGHEDFAVLGVLAWGLEAAAEPGDTE
jgi:hypothetical protein